MRVTAKHETQGIRCFKQNEQAVQGRFPDERGENSYDPFWPEEHRREFSANLS